MTRCSAGALLLTAALAPATSLAAQAVVSALVQNSEPLAATEDVVLSRFADFSSAPGVAVGTELAPGDMLSSVSGTTDVELTCGEESVLRFAGGFRVLIDAPEAEDCAVNFLSGTLDVLTDRPTEIDTGTVILGSEGTQFTVELNREAGEAERRLVVFDGRVRVLAEGVDTRVETGATWRLARGEAIWGQVGEGDLDRTAARYAEFDAAREMATAPGGDKAAVVERFKALHYEVLRQPDDTGKRADLAREQLKVDQTPQALYHLKRGDLTTPEKLETYHIDKDVAGLMTRSAVSIDRAPYAPPERTAAAADPFALIEAKRWEEAIEVLLGQANDGASSRVYYGLAQAYLGLEGIASSRAEAYARRALDLNLADRELSPVEVSHCRRIRDTRP